MAETIPLKVAVRVRPLIEKEENEGCQICVNFVPNVAQIILGKDRSFTYDHVFSISQNQVTVYEEAVQPLIKHIFKGYNATVLAYGQTGSGKTFTMGGGYAESLSMDPEAMGVIPRIVTDLFGKIQEQSDSYAATVHVSYLEIINEDLQDLLTTRKTSLSIREENGMIKIPGLKEQAVSGPMETMRCLEQGGSQRTTAATAMNNASSRSHAIFTIGIEHRHKEDTNDFWTAKLQLVDLAGSERVKKTHAEGERLKEGININKGLLSLGNVISALGDETQKKSHIPYRDSKLTRILQDSLGGNSHTLMIACVSPADSNMEETLNTLRYADRARKIKNKPVVNWDPQTAKIMQLQETIQQLNLRLASAGLTDVTSSTSTLSSARSDIFPTENNSEKLRKLNNKITELEEENLSLSKELQISVDQCAKACEKNVRLEMKVERLKNRLKDFESNLGLDFSLLSFSMNVESNPGLADQLEKLKKIASIQEQVSSDTTEETEAEEEEEEEEMEEALGELAELETPESRQMAKQHTLKRARLNNELQELNRILEKKEKLANQMAQNDDKVIAMKHEYENTVKQLEVEITDLQSEKENLTTALESAKTNSAANKVSEQRRKRLKELEGQLSDLKKKITEQKKLLKLKEGSDKQVGKLNTEIQGLKQTRVKLMKQMKEDADNWRKWKMQKDREVLQLQQKDRKRQFEIQKLQRENQKQQNVLQRKSEEASAANRRLKEALAKQKMVLEERSQKFDKFDKNSIGNRIKKILSHELDVKVSIMEAKYHRQGLLDDRKTLAEDLKALKESLDDNGPPSKKMAWMSDGKQYETSFQEQEIRDKIKTKQEQIEIRNAQISDLQQKIFDAEQEGKGKEASVHTMMEAKVAIKWLMEQAMSYKADNDRVRGLLKDEKDKNEQSGVDHNKDVEELEKELEDVKKSTEKQILKLKKDHQKEIQLLLSMGATGSSPMKQSRPDVTKELNEKEEQLKKLQHEMSVMEKNMTKYMYKEKSLALMPDLTDEESTSSPFLTPRPKPKFTKKSTALGANFIDIDDDDDDDEDDDENDDPDWVKTPMYKKEVKAKEGAPKRRKTDLFKQTNRLSSGDKCKCTSRCSTKRCPCVKIGGKCTDSCGCGQECQNQEVQMPESTT